MENLLFFGVPIPKHIRVIGYYFVGGIRMLMDATSVPSIATYVSFNH